MWLMFWVRPGHEADHSLPSNAEVKEWVELYLHSSNMPSWRGAQLKHTDNFTFYTTKYKGRGGSGLGWKYAHVLECFDMSKKVARTEKRIFIFQTR
jgi:hypothetical protein